MHALAHSQETKRTPLPPCNHLTAYAHTLTHPHLSHPRQASELLSEVAQVLDEDAEEFVVQVSGGGGVGGSMTG